jgi:phosphohistidine phosphatase SixA
MARIYLVRHGQASLLEDDYDRLSPLGETQARHVGMRAIVLIRFSASVQIENPMHVNIRQLVRCASVAESAARAAQSTAQCATPSSAWSSATLGKPCRPCQADDLRQPSGGSPQMSGPMGRLG